MTIYRQAWYLVGTSNQYLALCYCLLHVLCGLNESASSMYDIRLIDFNITEHRYDDSESKHFIKFDLTLENLSSNNFSDLAMTPNPLKFKFLIFEFDKHGNKTIRSTIPEGATTPDIKENLIQIDNKTGNERWLLANISVKLDSPTIDCGVKNKLGVGIFTANENSPYTNFLYDPYTDFVCDPFQPKKKYKDPEVVAKIIVTVVFSLVLITFTVALFLYRCGHICNGSTGQITRLNKQLLSSENREEAALKKDGQEYSIDMVVIHDKDVREPSVDMVEVPDKDAREPSVDMVEVGIDNLGNAENTSSVYRQSEIHSQHRSAIAEFSGPSTSTSMLTTDLAIQAHNLERTVLLFTRPINMTTEERVYLTVYILRKEQIQHVRSMMAKCRAFPCTRKISFCLSHDENDVKVRISRISQGWTVHDSLTSVIRKTSLYTCEEDPQSFCELMLEKNLPSITKIGGTLHVEQCDPEYAKEMHFEFPFDLDLTDEDVKIERDKQRSLENLLDLPQTSHKNGRHGNDFRSSIYDEAYHQEAIMKQIEMVEPDTKTGLYKKKVEAVPAKPFNFDTVRVYDMFSSQKGLAYILNNKEFSGRRRRHGSNVDYKNMIYLFGQLGYEIEAHQNLKAKEILETISLFARRFNDKEAQYRSSVVVLMSHGDSGLIYGMDGKAVKLNKVKEYFDTKKCPKLNGKPKLFFVQACRSPAEHELSSDEPGTPTSNNSTSSDDQIIEDIKEPKNADMHFAYATSDGCLSLRHRVKGSWFVQAVVEVFLARAHEDNLDRLMKMVTRRVTQLNGRLYDHQSRRTKIVKQTPQRESSLQKDMYFLPGFPP